MNCDSSNTSITPIPRTPHFPIRKSLPRPGTKEAFVVPPRFGRQCAHVRTSGPHSRCNGRPRARLTPRLRRTGSQATFGGRLRGWLPAGDHPSLSARLRLLLLFAACRVSIANPVRSVKETGRRLLARLARFIGHNLDVELPELLRSTSTGSKLSSCW